ncbi:transforming acidic coiled-coil-containing protein 3-like isoform X2 [Acanthaster planci]|uniref:Transforming acidic coiled-coil-containing protein 3-like isoform X2 n=1 Tax=Acanthaster planci TaxID=133434 RepID=A0A8B7YJF9_ACAPL|nr:transforming acidic coiled-coil-containing protein 3-like isoform X2 [Acanthaster planci]
MGDVNSHEGRQSAEEDIPHSPQRGPRGRYNDVQRLNYTTVENINFNRDHAKHKPAQRSFSLPAIPVSDQYRLGQVSVKQSSATGVDHIRQLAEASQTRPRFMSVQEALSEEDWTCRASLPFVRGEADGKPDQSTHEQHETWAIGDPFPEQCGPEKDQFGPTLSNLDHQIEPDQFELAAETPYNPASQDKENSAFPKDVVSEDGCFPIEGLKEQDVLEVLQALGADTDEDPFDSPLSSLPNETELCQVEQSLTTEAELRDLHVNDNELRFLEKELDVEGSHMQEVANHCEALPASMLLPSEPRSWEPQDVHQDATLLPGSGQDNRQIQPEVTFETPARGPVTPCQVANQEAWDILRQLDEEERWTERVQVVTRQDHEEYTHFAREFLEEIIDNLPIRESSASPVVPVDANLPSEESATAEKEKTVDFRSFCEIQEEQKENLPPPAPEQTSKMEEGFPKTGKNIYDVSDEDLQNMNPFQTGSKLQNSPPLPASKKSAAPEFNYDDIKDPFGTSSKIQNSPKRSPKNAVHNASTEFEFDETQDPFTPTNQMQNSPQTSPKLTINNASSEIAFDDETYPFKPKNQVENSPQISPPNAANNNSSEINFDDIKDPFATTSQIPNSPEVSPKQEIDESNLETNFDGVQDPFSSKKSLQNSPDSSPKNVTRKARSTPKGRTPTKASKKSPSPKSSPSSSSVTKSNDSMTADGDNVDNIATQKPTLEVTPLPREEDSDYHSGQIKTDKKYEQFMESEEFVLAPEEASGVKQGNQVENEDFRPAEEGLTVRGLQRDISFEEMEFRLAEEVFASADPAAFDVDFLEKAGGSSSFQESALARQSLYVKFDPLVNAPAGGGAKGLLPTVSEPMIQEDDEDDLLQMQTPPTVTSTRQSSKIREKAMIQSASKANTEGRSGMTEGVDRLLAFSPPRNQDSQGTDDVDADGPKLSASLSVEAEDEGIVQPLRYSQADLDAAIKEAIKTVQKQNNKEINQYKKKVEEKEKTIAAQSAKQKETDQTTENLSALVTQYEKAMQQMMGDINKAKDSSQESVASILKEKEQALEDLASVENAFSDLHRRYEKLKQTVESYKKNEEVLKKCVSDYQAKLKKQEQRYQTLKTHAEEKIEKANNQIDMVKKSYEGELSALQAAVKREIMKVESMEKTIEQKTKENAELTSICDELIVKIADNK